MGCLGPIHASGEGWTALRTGFATPTSYWFIHTLGQIVTACATSGLTIDCLTEYPHSNREVEYDKYENRSAQLPMSYSLVARKP